MDTTLSKATELFDQLVILLDDAYWEASNINDKDMLHNLSRINTLELIELNKVSGLDGDLLYEAATDGFRASKTDFRRLLEHLPHVSQRANTSLELQSIIPDIIKLIP